MVFLVAGWRRVYRMPADQPAPILGAGHREVFPDVDGGGLSD